ncbi:MULTISPECIES: hypothetical protein [unclassified Ensifer]|uniref:hypothetical protein n=1 Tax=unclassified Ensifer TaxID=2633371 RepID=UPI0008131EEE|nr:MULTISPECIES: hypothetical protein [unclassified Ensifer]OCP05015.1 hypothetical protein BC362_14760 [Ensifer sp. LC14]OCP11826.1 hypothetical protein BC374_16245 [Ensifer sp. LC13]OCP12382.1 hypothetical protein BBX50_16440 [Ensifer sp. LC11]OCP33650.1 hypothetical protein BC364_15400 [Ensifer sp. LC499]
MTGNLPKNMGEKAERFMAAAMAEGVLVVGTEADMRTCRNLNSRGLLRRNQQDASIWYPTDRAYELTGVDRPAFDADLVDHGGEAIARHAANHATVHAVLPVSIDIGLDGGGVEVLTISPPCASYSKPREPAVIAARGDENELLATVERARTALTEDDVRHALVLSGGAYEEAKAAANYAEKVKASRELITKFRAIQADALKVETYATIRLAELVDAAQGRGEVSGRGRPKNVQTDDIFKLEEIGVDRRALHQARKLRDAELKAPGVVERAIADRIEAGLAPTRNAIRHAIGTRSASTDEKGDQLYETPVEATRTVLALESFSAVVKLPEVGRGAILRVLEAAGYDAIISDLRDRGTATRHGELQQVGDFLKSMPGETEGMDMVINPPYGSVANAFLAHAVRVHKPRKIAALLNLNFMCGFDDPDRRYLMDENPPSRIYVFTRRLPMMHRDGWDGPEASSQMNTAFFVWERNDDGTYGDGFPRIIRVDWKDFEEAKPLLPGAGGSISPMSFAAKPDEFARETPRKPLDQRVTEERNRALEWLREQTEPFDIAAMRRGVAIRGLVAGALLAGFEGEGLIVPDGEGRWQAVRPGELSPSDDIETLEAENAGS